MELLSIDFLGKPLRLEGSLAGWQQLFWDNQLVSQLDADSERGKKSAHEFKLLNGEEELICRLETSLEWQPFLIEYKAILNDQLVVQGSRDTKDIEKQTPFTPLQPEKKWSLLGLLSLGVKAFKSAKLIKVALASASLAAYSWLFSFQFALALIACLIFHEYGHVKAMKYFGMRTKGIYLVPFLGGLALSDEKINTRWQDVVISIMGPMFGFVLSLILVVLYWVTGEMFFAGLAVFNAFLNLFNLLPILPLDGGHILKSISFSMNSLMGILLCTAAALGGVALSYSLGLTLFGLLLALGTFEIVIEWRSRHHSHLLPLDRYGQVVAAVWYLALVTGLIGIIWYFASTGDQLLRLPLMILGT
ncbi:site-2 protease family protein [Vibrio sp. Isolate25]|uniref:site-2 protease family protein n=1 Tax=Vibrio TaxID=662 RepID=UPI001EFE41EA|nr:MULTISPECIES: site-2 protease family protein [Vibrio]MCG9595672.1 site-2 protease family protein [Vibrio sp. Isolate25]MCG9677169.1 site-2 protease family protein [Vibrio sp. Isolate24]USD34184.1 site-2 protease family protein [Vibrio sp. SCSIO 43186]USD47256.1 site-2 protease family protein [Vibrio sp. SCSIO 43145]USD71308.1 site-2 protease family protein [Vibrio sp. SCSIO 43139]